jgi:uncharacterized protein with NRDE domain
VQYLKLYGKWQERYLSQRSKAGGTWYVVDEKGTVLVLLNGANEKHVAGLNYRKSRGLIVLDIIGNVSPRDYWNTIDLDRIEPFTIVLFQDQELFQLRWNGADKEAIKLDANESISGLLLCIPKSQRRTG